ncbi:MAG TPA: O-antigen polymerase [Alloprevotella sp.]|nr:O-antigen polymerase [Alloprevotella sp.]
MLTFYAIFLSVCYLIGAYIGRRDIFSPRFIFNVFAWLKNIPYFVEYVAANDIPTSQIETYILFKFISFLCVNIGITIYERNSVKKRYLYREYRKQSIRKYLRTGIIVFLIGLVLKVHTIMSSGGVFYIMTHIQSRKELMAGQYYNELLSNSLLTCGVLLSLLCYLKKRKWTTFFIFTGIFLITAFSLIVFGARRPALMLLLQVIMLYHFVSSKILIRNIFKIKTLAITLVVVFFVLMMPMLRSEAETDLINNPTEWVQGAIDNSNTLFREFSYCNGDLFVFDYFDKHDLWYGRSYLNIPLQVIPRSVYPQKPPMDDGMYLLNLMYGQRVTPDMPTEQLYYQTSIPFTLEGSLFSNFGLLGIILGCILVGMFYQYVYKILVDTKTPIVMILIYQEIMFVFVPSVLHATSTIMICGIYWIIFQVLFRFKIKRVR